MQRNKGGGSVLAGETLCSGGETMTAYLKRPLLIAAWLLAAAAAPASAQMVFTETFSDASAVVWLDLGSGNNGNASEKYQPTFYYADPLDLDWVFLPGTFLAASAQGALNVAAGDKAVLLNESPLHAFALRHSIGVTAGNPYVLTFDHWGDNRPNTTNYAFEVMANSTVIGTVSRGYTIPGAGASTSFTFLAPSAALLLSFRDISAGDASGIIDNIVLTAIPEPETYAMLIAGIGLLGFLARRRRNALQ